MNILVVEDEENIRDEIAFFLEMEDHSITTAIDGLDAYEILKGYTPDLVITDLKMPRMNGMELLTHIRSSEHPDLPVIGITAYSVHDWVNEIETLGISRHLIKPFNLDDVMNAIVNVAAGRE